jgi:outer membrane protein OmpA-like peptidoglycan-associated protein
MKNIFIAILLSTCFSNLIAQSTSAKKLPTIGLHFFYNDFVTPALIKSNGLGDVLKNKQWNRPQKMEGGFGIDYLHGLTKNIDAVGTFNASWVNYLLPNSTLYGSSNFLLDINAGVHLKMLSDKHVFNPFLIAKAGYTSYKNINGFSLLPGAGLQMNVFNEAFILTTIEYRYALSNSLSNQFYYSIGIATSIFKKKTKAPKPVEEKPTPPVVKEPEPIKEEIKIAAKDIVVTVTDEATSQPLQYVEVSLKSINGNVFTATTNADGNATFTAVQADSYNISGRLNKIDATTASVVKDDFSKQGNQIPVAISHNDPRFTLVGNTVDKTAGKPVGNTVVTITNSTQSSTAFATSAESNGEFRTQLEANSDFVIVGKKASYISNIENISTKGLNRSATLYVKLQLGIEEAKAGTKIVLNKIYFETGKATLNTSTSGDLNKLVLFLKDNPAVQLEIQGHTDNTGSIATNNRLSQLRANSVVDYLVKNGIAKERLVAKGYGPTSPIADNETKEGKAQNRRVEMKVLQ